ncbi:MAG: hypothetical protein Q7T82_01795 [Armatimonadota bacterium]|nr:hypothetical protein [Armatimonadota bacterium]
MSNPGSEVLSQAIQATTDYVCLLDRMEQTTDELLLAIETWDSEKVQCLIEDRSRLCDQIGGAVRLLAILQPRAEVISASAPEAGRRLESAIERAREKERRLLARQSQAENALTSEIDKQRPALAQANEQRVRRKAYRGRPAQSNARFLDSRI